MAGVNLNATRLIKAKPISMKSRRCRGPVSYTWLAIFDNVCQPKPPDTHWYSVKINITYVYLRSIVISEYLIHSPFIQRFVLQKETWNADHDIINLKLRNWHYLETPNRILLEHQSSITFQVDVAKWETLMIRKSVDQFGGNVILNFPLTRHIQSVYLFDLSSF